jgi:HPt (histidine-containing phosphotransfer) domain-containing protein
MDDSPLFDRSALDGLRRYGQADFIRSMVDMYQRTTVDVPEKIAGLLVQNDLKAIAFEAHSLKSGAGNLGLVRLTNVAGELETVAKAGDAQEVAILVDLLPELQKLSSDLLARFVREL